MTSLQAMVTKTATFNGTGVSIAGMSAPFQWNLVIEALTSGSVAIFGLQTSSDAFNTDIRTEEVFSWKGPTTSDNPVGMPPKHEYDLHGFRAGTSGVTARVALLYLDASSSVTYSSWFTP